MVVASVSCIYGIGNPKEFRNNLLTVTIGDTIGRDKLLTLLVDMLYSREGKEFRRGNFRVKGDTVDVFLAYDVLFDNGIGIDEIDLRVFNRWGEVVYHAKSVDQALNIGWDGKHYKSGKKMEVGVYVWLLEATKLNGDKIGPLFDNVTLLR